MSGRWVVPLLLLLGCTDFSLVGPPTNLRSGLDLFISIRHADTLFLGLNGLFEPGSGATGRPRALLDSTMLVQGQPISPQVVVGERLAYALAESYTNASDAPDSIRARGPVLADPPNAVAMVSLSFPKRVQPYRLDHVAGSDLALVVTGSAIGSEQTRTYSQWWLQIRSAGGQPRGLFSMNAPTALPAQLRLSWEWFGESVTVGDSLVVSVSFVESHDVPAAPYTTGITVFAEFQWVVHVVSANSSAAVGTAMVAKHTSMPAGPSGR